MAQNAQKRSVVVSAIFVLIGLLSLLFLFLRKRSMKDLIETELWELGIDPQTARYWVAVSAHETANIYKSPPIPWDSKVLRDSKNLFNVIASNTKRLQYGEGQTIYDSYRDSISGPAGLYFRVLKPFKYPAKVGSLNELVDIMKSKGYFTSGIENYKKGVQFWYNKIYEPT